MLRLFWCYVLWLSSVVVLCCYVVICVSGLFCFGELRVFVCCICVDLTVCVVVLCCCCCYCCCYVVSL